MAFLLEHVKRKLSKLDAEVDGVPDQPEGVARIELQNTPVHRTVCKLQAIKILNALTLH